MAVVRKKQDDKNLKILRETVSLGGNKQCFDCGQRGPTYVNMTIGSFVCTRCSGVLRGLTPPHRVKSISMATFSSDEIEFIKTHGNDECAKTWLGLWDPKRTLTQEHRELMINKYERKRYYLEPASPLKSLTSSTHLVSSSTALQPAAQSTALSSSSSVSSSSTTILPHALPPVINGHSNGNSNKDANNAALRAITLTPPASIRLNSNRNKNGTKLNGIVQHQSTNNTININNNNSKMFNEQFTSDPDKLKTLDEVRQWLQDNRDKIENNNNNFNIHNILNGNGTNTTTNGTNGHQQHHINGQLINNDTKNSLQQNNGFSNNDSNNKFTPDIDFVADFGSASIFDATTLPTSNHNNCINNNNNNHKLVNGTVTNSNILQNGTTTSTNKNANADFADFDHNPIYNASAVASTSNQNSISNSQWNIWQQFQWPYMLPEQNRWSLPMSLSSTNTSLNSSGATFNSNSSISSTQLVDRYAALKDLDEQLRDVKEKDAFAISSQSQPHLSSGYGNNNGMPTANPFKQQAQQHAQQQPQQHQHHQISNPFQSQQIQQMPSTMQSWPNDFGVSSQNNNSNMFNGNSSISSQQQQQHVIMQNNGMNLVNRPTATNVPLNNGFGMHQQINPFAATTLNSNNPFL